MRISGKFLNSKISQQIALILFLAAFIPTALVTGLTHQTIAGLIKDHAHQTLVETSRNYALSAFSNLTFARASLIDLADILNLNSAQPNKLEILKRPTFRSLKLISPDGKVLDQSGHATYSFFLKYGPCFWTTGRFLTIRKKSASYPPADFRTFVLNQN